MLSRTRAGRDRWKAFRCRCKNENSLTTLPSFLSSLEVDGCVQAAAAAGSRRSARCFSHCERQKSRAWDGRRSYEASAASLKASDSVGWACDVRAMSSADALYSIARTASEIISPALGPMMWQPLRESRRDAGQSRQPRVKGLELRADAQDEVGLLLNDHLDKALGVADRLGTRVGRKGELADLVGDLGSLELLFGLADPSDLSGWQRVSEMRRRGRGGVGRTSGCV